MVGVSYATSEPDYAGIRNLTFETTTEEDHLRTRQSWTWKEIAGSGVVLVCIMGAYLYFRG